MTTILSPGVTRPNVVASVGRCYSQDYGDLYFSDSGGLGESRHVFINGCALPRRLDEARQSLTVLELGFGTGLNFLATLQLARAHAASVEYVAVERHPLPSAAIARVLDAWPELHREQRALLAQYPRRLPGFHRLEFANPSGSSVVGLTLVFHDVRTALDQIDAEFDAIYLDGFSPDKNPEMWDRSVIERLAQLVRPGARLATYSVSRRVRHALEQANFKTMRVKGFGSKRHCLRGVYCGRENGKGGYWHSRPNAVYPQKVAVVGGGIAGCAVARALAEAGVVVDLIDQQGVGTGASAVPVAVARPILNAADSAHASVHTSGFLQLERMLRRTPGVRWSYCTVHRKDSLERLQASTSRWESAAGLQDVRRLGDVVGIRLVLSDLCLVWSAHPAITCRNARAVGLEFAKGAWILTGVPGRQMYEAVVLANSTAVSSVEGLGSLAVQPARGQTVQMKAHVRMSRTVVDGLQVVDASFASDAQEVSQSVPYQLGSTFSLGDAYPGVLATDTEELLHRAQLMFERCSHIRTLFAQAPDSVTRPWANVRGCTADRLPLVGPMIDRAAFCTRHRSAALGAKRTRLLSNDIPDVRPGVYLTVGHGARGACAAPIAGEVIAAHLLNRPLPLSRRDCVALHPARFLWRDLKRQKIR